MRLYDKTFRQIETFERRWSPLHVLAALAVIAAAIVGMVLIGSDLGELSRQAREDTQDSALVRSRLFGGMGPAIVLFGLGVLVIVMIVYLFDGGRPWHLRGGPRLRRRHHGVYEGDGRTVDDLYARFSTGDPDVYTPLPTWVKGGDVVITIWTAPERRYGLVGLTWGQNPRKTHTVPPITFEGEYYDGLETALARRMKAPKPV